MQLVRNGRLLLYARTVTPAVRCLALEMFLVMNQYVIQNPRPLEGDGSLQ